MPAAVGLGETDPMAEALQQKRTLARQLSGWLVERNRSEDAIGVLCAWAVVGPNDADGQDLVAEALRINPSAPLAQMAFERMEGIEGEQSALDAAVAHFTAATLETLEAEMRRPTFRRAQMGFNNNVRWKGITFHVQTEDSGLDAPHIVTHLFADGGRIIKSHKRDYSAQLQREELEKYVRSLMKAQHMEMVLMLRDGKFDSVLAGETIGGLDLLTEPPNVDLQKLARRGRKERVAPEARMRVQEEEAPERILLTVLRSVGGGPGSYVPKGDDVVIGSAGQVPLEGDPFQAPRVATIRWRDGKVTIEDVEGTNGVFLRIRTAVELEEGDEFVVGDQVLRIERNPLADDHPDPDPTYFYSSPKWRSAFRVVQVFEGARRGACSVSRGSTLQVGAAIGDLLIAGDPLVADQHCLVEDQAGSVVLTDLSSRTGVFVRVRGEQELSSRDELLVGRTRLVVEF